MYDPFKGVHAYYGGSRLLEEKLKTICMAGFLNALTNRPKSLSLPRTRKRRDTLSTMDVEPDLKLTSYIGAVVKTYFPVCSFLTYRRSVKRRWGAFNTDSPRSCLLDKIRRHLCDNALPFQNYLEFGLTGIPVHKRVKKPRFEFFESESYVKNIFTNYVVSINKAETDICFNVLKKSLFMSFIGLKYSEADNTTVGIFQIKYCQPISKINNKILTVTDRTHIF